MYTAGHVRAIATIDDVTVDISEVTVGYSMNTIPACTMVLAPGRNAATGAISNAHRVVEAAANQAVVKVFIEITPGGSDSQGILPTGITQIFEGKAIDFGYRQTTTGLGLTLTASHWLMHLAGSSAISASSHPNNPAQFSFNAVTGDKNQNSAHQAFITTTMAQLGIALADLKEDMWGNAIKPWFEELTSVDRFNMRVSNAVTVDFSKNDSTSGDAAAALKRFVGDKLTLDVSGGADGDTILSAISADIACTSQRPGRGTNSIGDMAHTTLWDKLAHDLASTYMFAIVPRPTDALVVPFIAGLQTPYIPDGDYTILSRDIEFLSLRASLARPLRGVGLYTTLQTLTNSTMSPNVEQAKNTIGGLFVGREDGMFLLLSAPSYLEKVVSPSAYVQHAAGLNNVPRATAIHPKAGRAPTKPTPEKIMAGSTNHLDRLAQAIYVTNVLNTRAGVLNGPLRFDIAPGSTIFVEGGADEYLGDANQQAAPFYASVQQVTINVTNGDKPNAGTSFQLAHCRSKLENTKAATSVAKHPLYENTWPGDALVTA